MTGCGIEVNGFKMDTFKTKIRWNIRSCHNIRGWKVAGSQKNFCKQAIANWAFPLEKEPARPRSKNRAIRYLILIVGPGTGDRGPGTGDRGPGTGDRGPGDRGPGTGDRGPGTGDRLLI
jgi:hypothetical protein